MRIHVLTGGPCSGKTTVLTELSRRGWSVIYEVARTVIDERRDLSFDAFQTEVLRRQLAAERAARKLVGRDHIADRGTLDNLAYCRAYSKPVPTDLMAHSITHHARRDDCPYSTVLLLDRLPYVQDGGRLDGEDDKLAARIHEEIACVYAEHGYAVVRVPVIPVDERADYIERQVSQFKVR